MATQAAALNSSTLPSKSSIGSSTALCSLKPSIKVFASTPEAAPISLPPHQTQGVSRTVTKESLRDEQEESANEEIQNLGLEVIGSDLVADPYYRITPPPTIEGRESPLLFAASFGHAQETALSNPIVTPLPPPTAYRIPPNKTMSQPPPADPTQPPTSLPQPSPLQPATHPPPPIQPPIQAPVKSHATGLIHHPPPLSIPRPYTKPPPQNPSPQPSSPASENTGRWTAEEHRLFLQGLEEHGKGWKKIASLIQTRTVVQIRTHAQKYFQKLAKARANGEAEFEEKIPPPVGAVHMRTLAPPGNMSVGTDSVSMAAAAGQIGTGSVPPPARKRRTGQGTKRRAIGSVVRSSVREGRNYKRQKMVEVTIAEGEAKSDVPNPLPAISNILDPYVMAPPPALGAAPPAEVDAEKAGKKKSRGRQQLVNTATHGTLPMAALEDAVFRLLTPAPGATSHTTAQQPPPNPSIVDPLAPNPVKISAPYPGVAVPPGHVPNSSPTCVTDISTFPSWVDAQNPPAWYNDGADIDSLLDDAEGLNWLVDTGDLDETYPPAVAAAAAAATEPSLDYEPTPVNVHPYEYAYHDASFPSSDSHLDGAEHIDPTLVHDPMTHPSVESLSFLVDSPEEGVDEIHSFLDEDHSPHPQEVLPYASATEAIESVEEPEVKLHTDDSHGNLMSFPDLDMGDEQAFVSALLDTSKESVISFSKWGSQAQEMAVLGEEDDLQG